MNQRVRPPLHSIQADGMEDLGPSAPELEDALGEGENVIMGMLG
jgi:hypothetical protein